MACLVLQLINYLPAVSSDPSFLRSQKWSGELQSGQGV